MEGGRTGFEQPEELIIQSESVLRIVKEAIEATITPHQQYEHAMVGKWVNSIIENCMEKLKKLNKPFKFVTNCLIMRQSGGGLHLAASAYWDNAQDNMLLHKDDANRQMYTIVCVYWTAL
eukprot:TRINITY_DN24666_c0_g1_i1.p1 TRINITY_DN24666_c0_g1~~TRINITY_DN24666_c0_g1_i1.p1  ORF type:complete len:137 (+),score=71.33 TRINITY_DN24666_c0_g1_i1:53-412(+)